MYIVDIEAQNLVTFYQIRHSSAYILVTFLQIRHNQIQVRQSFYRPTCHEENIWLIKNRKKMPMNQKYVATSIYRFSHQL